MDKIELMKLAKYASNFSYSPYSNFKVGASLVTKDGKTYYGCNIENASYGLTNCAERTCVFKAYSEGVRKDDIVAFAVYSPKEYVVSPCGACRQVLAELIPNDIPVYMVFGEKLEYIETTIKELLPYTFSKEDL